MSGSKVIEVEYKIQAKKRQQLVWGVELALLASASDLSSGGTELFPLPCCPATQAAGRSQVQILWDN